MTRKHLPLALLAAGMTLGATASFGQDAPNPGEVYVEAMNYWGDGCPAGTVADNLSPDAKALTLLFSDFVADSTTNRGREVKKSCALNLKLHVPQGWTYTLFSVDYRGYADLDEDSEMRLRSWYSMNGQSIRISNLKVDGPLSRDYQQRAWVPLDTLPWLSCNDSSTTIGINTELMVDGPHALLTVDSVDGELKQNYGIAWKRCSTASTWAGACEAVLETVWGMDMNRFKTTSIGATFQEAKARAEQSAQSQCQAARGAMRPLARATTRCVTDAPTCVARPL